MIEFLQQAGYVLHEVSDVWQRPGYDGIAYSDGDAVEARIRRIVDEARDLSVLSDELRARCTDWPSLYHLTSLRANLLRPFSHCLQGDVLEIGAGCGAITRFLGECGGQVLALEGTPRRAGIARSRTRDLRNVTVLTESFERFACARQFDVVTLIGVLEYANLFIQSEAPALTLLQKVRSLLKPDGRLILAIENQMGLKYFAGAPEDHLGISMYGIEDRYQRGEAQTFGRLELEGMLAEAGFATREFMTPLPDYKLPVSIITSHGLADEEFDASALGVASVVRDHQLGRETAFELQLAWPSVFNNGLALELANSFLVCASPEAAPAIDADVLGYHYSAERRLPFCKKLLFRRTSDQVITIESGALAACSEEELQTTMLTFQPPGTTPYYGGSSMVSEFLRIVNRPDWTVDGVVDFVKKYLAVVAEYSGFATLVSNADGTAPVLPSEAFDLIPQNIIVGSDGRAFPFDLEWSARFSVEPSYLLFRALFVSLGGLHRCAAPADAELSTWKALIQSVAQRCELPISDECYAKYIARELEIRKSILGGQMGDANLIEQYILPIAFSYGEHITRMREQHDHAVRAQTQALAERDQVGIERDLLIVQLNQMRTSRSWRLTAPLRFAARCARHGLMPADRERLVSAMRRRYHQLPLPMSVKRLLSSFYHQQLARFLGKVRRSAHKGMIFVPPSLPVRAQGEGVPDYIVWGVIDWHFRYQRPQHLATALAAAGRRVFYISPVFVDDDRAGFDIEALDADGTLFQVKLYVASAPVIYTGSPSSEVTGQLRNSIGELLDWADSTRLVSLVQHPFWQSVAPVLPNSHVVYDCMDLHEGFSNFSSELLANERALLESSDLIVTTSTWLDDIAARYNERRMIVRNAGEYSHFSAHPGNVYCDPQGRQIIGYYGAIAEWFDIELIQNVARSFPECCVLLIGADTAGAREKLAHISNIQFLGEVPYGRLPFYLHAFDVALLPFQVVPLTLATNPVKVYEYLSAGKPVVSVDLPELRQFGDLVYVAKSHAEFVEAVGHGLVEGDQADLRARRQFFAQGQTWEHRAVDLIRQIEQPSDAHPLVSIIVVTYNNLELTKVCLASIDAYSQYHPIEIIVVDNASSDGSPVYLREWAAAADNRYVILNEDNRGFAAANNQGLARAQGAYLVLLNNDTHVTPGWIRTMIQHLRRDSRVGLVGPVTNNIGNEARINISYDNMGDMLKAAGRYTRRHIGRSFEFPTAAFFCVMLPRHTYEQIGELDEQFGRGFFEDDDYCRRIEQAGMKVLCVEDVFIHHHLSASFNKLRSADRQALFEQNKALYEAKWGPWMPHRYRDAATGGPDTGRDS